MHSNVTSKKSKWLHFSWATLYGTDMQTFTIIGCTVAEISVESRDRKKELLQQT